MLNNSDKNSGFSLIEILQTVILVGIIAGLSVSFFKKVNNDDKLMMSTTFLIKSAVEEANVQMCSDETPYCYVDGSYFSPLGNNETADDACKRYYGNENISFDDKLGFCTIPKASVAAAPTIQIQNIANLKVRDESNHIYEYEYNYYVDAPSGEAEPSADVTGTDTGGTTTESTETPTETGDTGTDSGETTKKTKKTKKTQTILIKIDPDNKTTKFCSNTDCTSTVDTITTEDDAQTLKATVLSDFKFFSMLEDRNLNNVEIYYAPLPCVNPNNLKYGGQSQPLSNFTCPDNVPKWDVKISRNVDCFDGGSGSICPNDSTYGSFKVSEICYRLWDIINHKEQTVNGHSDLYMTCVESNPCINTQDCDSAANTISNQTNMILPSGARIYNLSCVANTDCTAAGDTNNRNVDHQHIFIKADRISDDRTFKFTNTSTSIINAVQWFDNNIYDKTTQTFKPGMEDLYGKTIEGAQTYKQKNEAGEVISESATRAKYTKSSSSIYNPYIQKTFQVDDDGKPKASTTP